MGDEGTKEDAPKGITSAYEASQDTATEESTTNNNLSYSAQQPDGLVKSGFTEPLVPQWPGEPQCPAGGFFEKQKEENEEESHGGSSSSTDCRSNNSYDEVEDSSSDCSSKNTEEETKVDGDDDFEGEGVSDEEDQVNTDKKAQSPCTIDHMDLHEWSPDALTLFVA